MMNPFYPHPMPQPPNNDLGLALPVMIRTLQDILQTLKSQGGGTPDSQSKTGWSQSGTLITGNAQQSVGLQAQMPEIDTYTVQFQVSPPVGDGQNGTTVGANLGFRATAFVRWSIAGNTITRQVDIGNGVSISGVCEACQVIVNDSSAAQNPQGYGYTVSINIAKGVRATNTQMPLLMIGEFLETIARGPTSKSFSIPAAGVIAVRLFIISGSTPAAVFNAQLLFLAANGTIIDVLQIFGDYKGDTGFIPVPPNAQTMALENFDAGNTIQFNGVWGIDG